MNTIHTRAPAEGLSALAASLLLLLCLSAPLHAQQEGVLPDRLIVTDQVIGDGPELRKGMFAVLHYTGWIYDPSTPDNKGRQYISSRERGEPLSYVYGYERAIRGLERGMQGMHVGGKRTIVIPPKLAYQEPKHPHPQDVPKGSALVFEVELLNVVPQSAPRDQ
jgi:FKBP-type peptidyl-prolyl cis-trans isomerase